ncbi:hypothetical protein H072_1956 [Dactylellina haptotyla CBS 200.50]|uniref:Cwf19-like C-terminal domain-containing protein n=1 Tax=Dactylellina haptotyla (strain CBS 200.50) TaxID=1284197 RepID=S8ASW8_DACHA|nr:hypothetical protein H072_1956 [Dactylellina haptotyla CBS 200.50]
MASSQQHSIIIVGNPSGAFPTILSKLSTLHKKNSFSFAVVLGDLFPSPETLSDEENDTLSTLLRGGIEVALPVYFTLGSYPFPPSIQDKIDNNAGEVCENLFFLGKRSTFTTSDGVRIVTLGGRLDPTLSGASKESKFPFYSEQDSSTLKGSNYADLLITGDWPHGVSLGSKVSIPSESQEKQKSGNTAVQKLAQSLRPRYHFVSGGGGFYEREPYKNEVREKDGSDTTELVSRFIAVADYGNAAKAKWMYAFKLDLSTPAITIPPNCTVSPYAPIQKRPPPESSSNFFWGDQSNDHHHGHHRNKRSRHHDPRPPPPGPDTCFFCLSNPNIQKHLITSIGSNAYLTTAKGPLTTPLVNAEVSFPGHILIIPFEHTPTLQGIQDEETFESTVSEMNQYRDALGKMYTSLGCGMITFEVVRRMGFHPHWQVVPAGKQYIKRVKSTFEELAKEEAALGEIEEREAEGREEGDFFRVWIRNENGEDESLVMKLHEKTRFDLQFGRKVLSKVFGLEDRANWKDCAQDFEDEVRDAEAFKQAFKDFDFSLDD